MAAHSTALADNLKFVSFDVDNNMLELTSRGDVWWLGRDFPFDQITGKETPNKQIFQQLLFTNIKNIRFGPNYATSVVTKDGKLYGWWMDKRIPPSLETVGWGIVHGKSAHPHYIMDEVRDAILTNSYNLALKNDGTLWVWNYGKEESMIKSLHPLLRNVKTFTSVNGLFGEKTAAVTEDGALWYWGEKMPLVDPRSNVLLVIPPQKLMKGIADCLIFHFANGDTMLALGKDGTLYLWYENEGLITIQTIAHNVIKIKGAEAGAGCFLTKDGRLWNLQPKITDDEAQNYLEQYGVEVPESFCSSEYAGRDCTKINSDIFFMSDNVEDFYPGANISVIKKLDGSFHVKFTSFFDDFLAYGEEEGSAYPRIKLQFNSTGVEPFFDLNTIEP